MVNVMVFCDARTAGDADECWQSEGLTICTALLILVCIVGIRLFGAATNATMQDNASRIESSIQGTTVQYEAE